MNLFVTSNIRSWVMQPRLGWRIWLHVGLEALNQAMSGEMYGLVAKPRECLAYELKWNRFNKHCRLVLQTAFTKSFKLAL